MTQTVLHSFSRPQARAAWCKCGTRRVSLTIARSRGCRGDPRWNMMSYATNDWQKDARIVGHALASQMDDCIIWAGDLLLVARLDALVESGRLEIRGEPAHNMHVSEVRLTKAA
jgi:hypothetical protein